MRRSQRIAGFNPIEDSQLHFQDKLVSLRYARRGQLSNLAKIINRVLICLNAGEIQNALALQETMLAAYMKFRSTNTEYMSIEIDPRKIRECEESEQRESNRVSEVELSLIHISEPTRPY